MSVQAPGSGTGPHPIHAILLSFPIALFTAAVATDLAYLRFAEIQWTNFSSWLITGALVFGGLVLAWAAVSLIVPPRSSEPRRFAYPAVLLVMWIVGLVNAFKHSQDGWSSVGAFGLGLSIVSAVLAVVAGVIAYGGVFDREASQ